MPNTSATVSTRSCECPGANIAGMLLNAVRHHSRSGVYVTSGDQSREAEFLSYPALLEEAQHMLGGLQERAARSDAKVALLLERPRDFIPAFWACVLGGYIPCPLAPIRSDPDRWADHVAHVDVLLDRPLFVSAGGLLSELPASVASASIDDLRKGPQQLRVYSAELSSTAILMLTSGSTGASKAVVLTHSNLLASMAGRAERQELSPIDVMFNWIAFDHVAALLESHMIALYVGATQLHCEPASILTDPLQFLRLIHRYRVSVAFAPNFLLGQINAVLDADFHRFERDTFDLSCLRRIVTGGEANVVSTGRRFLDLLAPFGLARNALWPAFGMTETCAASIYSHEFPNCDDAHEFASVGSPIAGLEVRIVDEERHVCPGGQVGELELRGPMIFSVYCNNQEATRAAFTEDGWFRTGDIGRLEDGRICLVARSKDSIVVNGSNFYSQELETKLEQLPNIERAFVAAFPTRPQGADTEQLVVAFSATLPPEDEEGLYQLLVAIRNTTIMLWGFRPALVLPLAKSAFPKTSLGKIQRSLMRKRLECGELDGYVKDIADVTLRQIGPFVAPEGRLERDLGAVFAQILRVDPRTVSTTTSFFDLGGTSLDILKFTQALERRFGFKTGLPVVLRNPTVRELASHISSGGEQRDRIYDPIVPLQVTGRKTPIFCVHPGNGEVFVLVNLAKYFLNDRPFYALRPRGFNENEEPFKTVEEMVDTYVSAILKRQPHGPYAIAGYSLGCEIAFEVAKRLEALGRSVGFLGCIDAAPRYQVSELEFNMATGLAMVIDLITLPQFSELNKTLSPTRPNDEVCEYILRFASPDRMAELDLDLHKFAVWARVAHSLETMLFGHLSAGTVQSMTVFCSEGISSRYVTVQWSREAWRKELQHWDDFVVRSKYIDIPGHHHTLMGPKHVAIFQSILRAEIDLAMEEH